jgi:hypothetical protein
MTEPLTQAQADELRALMEAACGAGSVPAWPSKPVMDRDDRKLAIAAVNALPTLLASHARAQELEAERDALKADAERETQDSAYYMNKWQEAEALLQRARKALENAVADLEDGNKPHGDNLEEDCPFCKVAWKLRAALDAIGREGWNDLNV